MIHFIAKPAYASYDIFSLCGFIPDMLSQHDPRPAREQINSNYPFGGWSKFEGFTMKGESLCYPGDPPMKPLAEGRLRDERVLVYPHAWVAIIQPSGKFEVARID